MGQPIQTVEQEGLNPLVISEWRVDGNGVVAGGVAYVKGSVLGKNVDGNFELTADATKAEAILLDDVDATTGVSNAPILTGGAVDQEQLVLGGDLTLADVEDALRNKNIYLK
jgi:hypothetical protein